MSLLPKSIHRCRRYPTKFNSGRDIPGQVDNILKIHSLNPPSLEGHFKLYAHLMRGPSGLTRVEREMIAVAVSKENACHY